MIVILGTAHLQTTAGKCSPDGRLHEAVYSREIVGELKSKLESYGCKVFIDYEPLTPDEGMLKTGGSTEQAKELSFRVKCVNQICQTYGTANCIYVSVHVNAAGADKKWHTARGFSVYTSRGKTNADKLATFIWESAKTNLPQEVAKYIRSETSDGDPDYEADFYVLKNTKCPAVLTENMFMDNIADTDFLLSEEGRHTIERLHIEGILKYIESL